MGKFLEYLAKDPVFSKFDLEDRKRVAELATQRVYHEGEYIAHYGDHWPCTFITMQGVVNILKLSSEGRTLGALRLGSGEVFWSPSFFDEGPLPASLEVKGSCTIYLWQRDDLLPVIKSNHEVMWQICLLMAQRIRMASDYVEELAFQPVSGRLAKLLLEQFKGGDDLHIARDLTLDEMGSMTGTTSVMVCKILSRFSSDGLIKVGRTQLSLLDQEKLEQLADRNKG
jgi:CRP/FNR family cyclic AMP-dependent transcriptional regulator